MKTCRRLSVWIEVLSLALVTACSSNSNLTTQPSNVPNSLASQKPAALASSDGLTYTFSAKLRKCVDKEGKEGLNNGHVGECGNLKGADLSNQNLSGKSFLGADLTNANLNNAILREADLRNTNLTGANLLQTMRLTDALYNAETKTSLVNDCGKGELKVDQLRALGMKCRAWPELEREYSQVIARMKAADEKYENAPDVASQIESLLKLRLDPEQEGNAALKYAIELKSEAITKVILKYSTNVDTYVWKSSFDGSEHIMSTLGNAVWENCFGCAELLLAHGANPNPPIPNYFSSPLVLAVEKERTEWISYLLKHGADPNYFDGKSTPLIVATKNATYGDFEVKKAILKLLLEGGGDPGKAVQTDAYFKDIPAQSVSALTIAESLEVIKLLLAKNPDLSTRYFAYEKDAKIAEYLLQLGKNPNERSVDGKNQTALMKTDSPYFAEFLIKNGADLSLRDSSEMTALSHAIANLDRGFASNESLRKRGVDYLKFLLTHGASAKGSFNFTQISYYEAYLRDTLWAKPQEIVEVTELLIKAGTDLNQKTLAGQPLFNAVIINSNFWSEKNPEIAQLARIFTQGGYDWSAVGPTGRNAFLEAIAYEGLARTQQILDAVPQLSVTVTDKSGRNGLSYVLFHTSYQRDGALALEWFKKLRAKGLELPQIPTDDERKRSPLRHLVREGAPIALIADVIEAGGDPKETDSYGYNLLISAISRNPENVLCQYGMSVIKLLIAKGADPKSKTKHGTLLHYLLGDYSRTKFWERCEAPAFAADFDYLLDLGIDLNALTEDYKYSFFHELLYSKAPESKMDFEGVFKKALARGLNPNLQAASIYSNEPKSLLQVATEHGYMRIAKILIEAGATDDSVQPSPKPPGTPDGGSCPILGTPKTWKPANGGCMAPNKQVWSPRKLTTDAKSYCETLSGGDSPFGGRRDWRVPTLSEFAAAYATGYFDKVGGSVVVYAKNESWPYEKRIDLKTGLFVSDQASTPTLAICVAR